MNRESLFSQLSSKMATKSIVPAAMETNAGERGRAITNNKTDKKNQLELNISDRKLFIQQKLCVSNVMHKKLL